MEHSRKKSTNEEIIFSKTEKTFFTEIVTIIYKQMVYLIKLDDLFFVFRQDTSVL